MVWSYSSSRIFSRCQRQWYIKQHFASAVAKKNPLRREAYLYSTLQSLHAWRGSLVDTVITKAFILPMIQNNYMASETQILQTAEELFNRQLDFALKKRAWLPGMTKKAAGDDFASLYPVVYEQGVNEEDLKQIWEEIRQALSNFRRSDELMDIIQDADHLAAQRPLTFTYDGVSARMIPDLIVFYDDLSPLIIDWKVQQTGNHNARRQLAAYALALVTCKPHIDFPDILQSIQATDVSLMEVQLLTKQHRQYSLSETDVEAAITHIVQTHDEMRLATLGNPKKLSMSDFSVTSNPDTCQRCNFRSICWEQDINS